ncbi:enamine/imine deaminase [Escherichia coli]
MKKIIETQRAPGAIGPYVRALISAAWLHLRQIPVCPQTGEIPADVQDQGALSLENVKAIVVAAGLSVGDIIKMTVFITNLNDFATINEVYKQFFDEHQATYPTRSCVQVARLPKDVKLEIEAIAVRSA